MPFPLVFCCFWFRRRSAMANPSSRRYSNSFFNSDSSSQNQSLSVSSFLFFLKKPQAFPFLLSIFVLLTWVSLRFQHPTAPQVSASSSQHRSQHGEQWRLEADKFASLVRFSSQGFPSEIFKDKRGWLLNPVAVAQAAGISGGAVSCASLHVGEIRPGGVRGNHRHHTCNETFVFWGAETKFRVENDQVVGKGYAEATIGPEEVAVSASSLGTAHALINMDPTRATFFLGCQDNVVCGNQSTTDFKVWKDL